MKTSSQRMLLAGAAVVLALGALLIVRPGDSDEPDQQAAQDSPPALTGPTGKSPASSQPKPDPRPPVPVVTIRNGEPVGGVREIEIDEGDRVRFVVKSDVDDEVHVHGFDVSEPVGPGKPARFDFPASFTGVFEVELELTAVPIIELVVNP